MAASPSIDNLATVWGSLSDLCAGFGEEQWKAATGVPGWSVQDNLSHIVDYESRAVGNPGPEHTVGPAPHLKNPLGESNEIGVDFRRLLPGAQVLEEFRIVTELRLQQLRALTADDLAVPMQTPAGPGTAADMLRLRVMDSWIHEQDIRSALGIPGHLTGPVVDEALGHLTSFLPYVVGKRAKAPSGATVVVAVAGRDPLGVEVVEGRARAASVSEPHVTISTDVLTLAFLLTGRIDPATAPVTVDGDTALARAIVENMNVMI